MKRKGRTRVRFPGLVAAVRRMRESLVAGMAGEAKKGFLESARNLVRGVEDSLKKLGAGEAALSPQARQALSLARSIALLEETGLPDQSGDQGPKPGFALRRVESGLNRALAELSTGVLASGLRESLIAGLERKAARIEDLCATAGTSPSALIDRTRRAYCMIKWLSRAENFDIYLSQAALAVEAVKARTAEIRPDLSMKVEVEFRPGSGIYSMKCDKRGQRWRLALGFLDACEDDFAAVAHMALSRGRKPDQVKEAYRGFIDAPEFDGRSLEIESLADEAAYTAKGRAHDLDQAFERVNANHFGGVMQRPKLHWTVRAGTRTLGWFNSRLDLAAVNAVIDDPRVPGWFVDFIVFHELLHKKHGFERRGRCRVWHSPAFRAEEKTFPGYAEAKEMGDRIGAGKFP